MADEKRTPENTGPGYVLHLESMKHFKNAMDHMVKWCGGIGILDSLCYAEYRPDWIRWDDKAGEWVHLGKFPLFDGMLEYWEKKGAKIENVGPVETNKLRERMHNDPDSFYPKEEKAKEEEKPKGKAKDEKKSDGPMPHEKKQAKKRGK